MGRPPPQISPMSKSIWITTLQRLLLGLGLALIFMSCFRIFSDLTKDYKLASPNSYPRICHFSEGFAKCEYNETASNGLLYFLLDYTSKPGDIAWFYTEERLGLSLVEDHAQISKVMRLLAALPEASWVIVAIQQEASWEIICVHINFVNFDYRKEIIAIYGIYRNNFERLLSNDADIFEHLDDIIFHHKLLYMHLI